MPANAVSSQTIEQMKKPKSKWGNGQIKRHISFLSMLAPGTLFLLIFSYLPMPAIILAFKQYQLQMPPKDYWIRILLSIPSSLRTPGSDLIISNSSLLRRMSAFS